MDKIISDVRKIRNQIVKEFNSDLHSLCEEIRHCEKQHKNRLVNSVTEKHSRGTEINDPNNRQIGFD